MTEGVKRGVPWTRIVAEFFLIFAGITLSLLADDWRQGLADGVEERSLLVSLAADLRADSTELAGTLNWAERHSRGAVWLILRLEGVSVYPYRTLAAAPSRSTFAARSGSPHLSARNARS